MKGHWVNKDNCRQFFIDFAKEKGFDPMVPDNWKNVTQSQIKEKGVRALKWHLIVIHREICSGRWNFT